MRGEVRVGRRERAWGSGGPSGAHAEVYSGGLGAGHAGGAQGGL